MKQTLSIGQRQQQKISPQLQQAIRIMQLSQTELTQEIRSICEANAMLEWDEDPEYADDPSYDEPFSSEEENSDEEFEEDELDVPYSSSDIQDLTRALDSDPGLDLNCSEQQPEIEWTEAYLDFESVSEQGFESDWKAGEIGLAEHLVSQLPLLDLEPTERLVAEFLIENLNDDGYLNTSFEDLLNDAPINMPSDPELLESVLLKIQVLSPLGVGARDVRECLLIQLRESDESSQRELALLLVEDCFDSLADRDFQALEETTAAHQSELELAVELIQSLNPRPGSAYTQVDSAYIVPDVLVRKDVSEWVVDVNDESTPPVRINEHYEQLVKQMPSGADKSFLLEQYREAKMLLDGLKHRRATLLKTATVIVASQQAFFEHGESAMQPLLRRNVAQWIGMHQSTVSRITSQKYLQCPRGIFELRYFFSSHVRTVQGSEVSSRAIKSFIQTMTEEEDPKRPLSDDAIARLLKQKDIHIARRTVAKYRESLSIPSSKMRQIRM